MVKPGFALFTADCSWLLFLKIHEVCWSSGLVCAALSMGLPDLNGPTSLRVHVFFEIKCQKDVWKISAQLGGSNPRFKTWVITGKSWLRVNHGLWKVPVLYRNCPKPGFWVQITVISRVNHGYNTGKSWVWGWKQSPPEIYLKKHWKKTCSRINVIISGGV